MSSKTKGGMNSYLGRLGYGPRERRDIIKRLKRLERKPEPEDKPQHLRMRRRRR
jgi:hypothetical protein